MKEEGGLRSPMDPGKSISPTATGGGATYDHLDAPFNKPRAGGGLPIVMEDSIPGVSPPKNATISGDGDLRLNKE